MGVRKRKKIISGKVSGYIVTTQDIKMVQMMADGVARDEIGQKLGFAPRTIDSYFERLKKNTNSATLPQLTALFFREKIIK